MILNRPIHSQSKTTLLLYPLQVGLNKRYIGDGKRLKQEDLRNIKEITKLLGDKASPDIRDLWLKHQRVPENQDAAVIKLLKGEQQRHSKIGSEKWLEDFIRKVKDYKEQKSIKENCGIAIEKPITKCVLQNTQLSKVSTNRACYIS
ncbi:hypothetical protein [Wolbachia endosymbiont of Trichogramma kaykai]|uniref:hypothetical protein n=1 Tax=Wolbachia endosymbiont of Trichogramma kaykai TaxID=444066 RepID=UPI0038912010